MSHDDFMRALSSLLSLAGIWVMVHWLYRDYWIDKFRQEMFALRDELFDCAAQERVMFDESAYGLLRSTMNGFIRFAHRLTLLHSLILTYVSYKAMRSVDSQSFSDRWIESLRQLPPPQADMLNAYRSRMHKIVVKHLLRMSTMLILLTLITVLPAIVMLVILVFFRQAIDHLRPPLDNLDSAAMSIGQVSEI